jgi:hypothetical protein
MRTALTRPPAAFDAITLVDFADTFAAKVNSVDAAYIHPAGAAAVWGYLCEMRAEAEAGRAADVARLTRRVTETIADESAWHEEKLRRVRAMRSGARP